MSSCFIPKDFASKRLVKGSLAVNDGTTIHFMVTPKKETNYLAYCDAVVAVADPVATINRYTEHTNGIYKEVNLSLAADSPALQDHGAFISDLRSSILQKPLLENCTLFRGVQLSDREIEQMEAQKHFFIPSFTSTSVNFDMAYEQSSLLAINTSYCSKYACSVTADLSRYYKTEREVLLACYSAFHFQRLEVVNKRKIVTLHLDEFSSSLARVAQDL
jgi:hypothetical protein